MSLTVIWFERLEMITPGFENKYLLKTLINKVILIQDFPRITYFPILDKRWTTLSTFLFMRPIYVASPPITLFKMAWSKWCGAISITTAFFGTWCKASWKSTGETKLCTKYEASANCDFGSFHLSSE